jgi:hypothetical protein
MEPPQLDSIDRTSFGLFLGQNEKVPPEVGDKILSPKLYVLNKRQDDG